MEDSVFMACDISVREDAAADAVASTGSGSLVSEEDDEVLARLLDGGDCSSSPLTSPFSRGGVGGRSIFD